MRLSVAAAISHGRVHRRLGLGPRSRLDMLRNLVTALVRHERIETHWARADEMRVYAERLIDYAKRGDADEAAMRMADFWLTEKDLIHKLFKVLAPRFQAHSGNYTRLLQIPNRENLDRAKMAVIEYKGNPFPPLIVLHRDNEKTLLNQLLKGYREDILKTRATQAPEGAAASLHTGTAV
ncbi:large ribosomal subunit protein bL17m [Caretta caretta]|uniref:large ribosomal subunit protein bL17m n=1 Tax=Caretta caretta TaxID=8467 RepID=UPI0020941AB7|nr:39S ribosomal protein L17, mitochondrial [Caretta caretta]